MQKKEEGDDLNVPSINLEYWKWEIRIFECSNWWYETI